ncbi:MAG TPA: PEP/pyruvate-binding domain-containing protein, partial [Actinomycetota bacterium]|nr:PEP/pyruvate-binding domain-containing protein [Actinomycetota bacterium]
EECAALAGMGRRLADLHGAPQDIEWAFDADGRLFLLQSRPITTI